jgi:hypothetical protein
VTRAARIFPVVVACVMLASLAVACGSGDEPRARTEHDIPVDIAPLLARFDLELQRSAIETRAHSSDQELSLYARPTAHVDADTYARRFAPLAAAVIPAMLAKYPQADRIDLCQMRAGTPLGVDDATPVTRIEITRAGADRIDWKDVDLATLLRANRRDARALSIEGNDGVFDTPTWQAAVEASRATGND